MKIVKNYLTSDELGFIISEMNKHESLLDKEVVKIGLVAQLCVDEFVNSETESLTCNDIYDKIVTDEIYDELYLIKNINIIDDCTVSTSALVENFLKDLNTRIDNYASNLPKDFNLEAMVGALKEVSK